MGYSRRGVGIHTMLMRLSYWAAILLVWATAGCNGGRLSSERAGQETAASQDQVKVLRVVVVGDSTVANYGPESTTRGWGQMLSEFFSDDVEIINLARSGRSSGSFIREGLWEAALAEKPDFFLIQFGHNDCPGKGDRYSDPESTFQDHLRRYITDSKAVGAVPILVTPMTRRQFTAEGKIRTILRPYAEAMIKVGRQENVSVVDLHARSVELFERLGEADSTDLSAKDGTDRTHFSAKGARAMARMIVEGLPAGPLKDRVRMPRE